MAQITVNLDDCKIDTICSQSLEITSKFDFKMLVSFKSEV